MPYYLVQAAYAPAAMAGLIQSPQDLPKQLRANAEKLGGKLEGFWLAFGEHDIVAICQMPDNQTMAALSMAVAAEGRVKSIQTTPLLTWAESLHAMQQANQSAYSPYGSPSTTI